MGLKSGRFMGRNGHEYEVTIGGDTVTTDAINLGIPPATISMAAGEHKFCGFKSTTATVNILTDVPLIELYSAGVTDIRLTITDATEGKVEFDGYVIPFAFDQPYTGKNDTVTINAVDILTARQTTPYTNIGDTHGVDIAGLDIVKGICERAGITEIVLHLNFNDISDTMANASPLDVKVAQAGFLQDAVSDTDALSAICKFFGYTGHVVGRTLFLYDEHCLGTITDANVYTYADGGWLMYAHYYQSFGSPLSEQYVSDTHNDISVSIERAYDGVQIKTEGSDVSVLLPDVCALQNMEENDGSLGSHTRTAQARNKDEDWVQHRTPRKSKLMDLGFVVDGEITDNWPSDEDPVIAGDWSNGAMALEVVHESLDRPTLYGSEVVITKSNKHIGCICLRPHFYQNTYTVMGAQKASTRYSHTGGHVKVSLTWGLREVDEGWLRVDAYSEPKQSYSYLYAVGIHCGNKLLARDLDASQVNPTWEEDKTYGTQLFFNGYKLIPTGTGMRMRTTDCVITPPSDEPIWVSIGGIRNVTNLIATDSEGLIPKVAIYIESLSIEGWGDSIDPDNAEMKQTFNDGTELLEVSTMLTVRNGAGVVNARPAVVPSGVWAAGYAGSDYTRMPVAGVLMTQLKARYAQPHVAYKMTVPDRVAPYAPVRWQGNLYTVEAYDRDLYNNTTTITID